MAAVLKSIEGKGLTAKQVIAAESIGVGGSVAAAAEAAGVGTDTIYRWQKQDDFQKHVQETLNRYVGTLIPSAIQALKTGLSSNQAWERLQSARDLINLYDKRQATADRTITVVFSNAPEPVLPPSSDRRVTSGAEGSEQE